MMPTFVDPWVDVIDVVIVGGLPMVVDDLTSDIAIRELMICTMIIVAMLFMFPRPRSWRRCPRRPRRSRRRRPLPAGGR